MKRNPFFDVLILLVLAAALYLPRLGASGFWDPQEIRLADAARQASDGAPISWSHPTLSQPPVVVALIATGFHSFGVREWGGRLPLALLSILVVLAAYYAGRAISRRAGLIAAAATMTSPLVFLGARQLGSDAPLLLSTLLSVGGFAYALYPKNENCARWMPLHVLIGLLGCAIGLASGGLLLGTAPALLGGSVALIRPSAQRKILVWIFVPLLIVTLILIVGSGLKGNGYTPLWGTSPHKASHTVTLQTGLLSFVYGFFPWSLLLPLCVAQIAFSDEKKSADEFLLFSLVGCYLLGLVQTAAGVATYIPVGPIAILLAASFLDHVVWQQGEARLFAALFVAVGAVLVGHDWFMNPEQLVSLHLSEAVHWPAVLKQAPVVMCITAIATGVLLAVAIGAPLGTAKTSAEVSLRRRRVALIVGAASVLAFGLTTVHALVPQVSAHLSARDLYGKAKGLDPNAPLGQYHFSGSGASYYAGKSPKTLTTLSELFDFLAMNERVFVLAGSDQLAAIDQESRQKQRTYSVIDTSNSRYLVLSNKLGSNEKDLNPLRRFVTEAAPTPSHPLDVDFEGKVELVGYDLPAEVRRGQEFVLRLYFKVKQPIGGSYKVFAHFDGPGTRFNGDHVPLEGQFPTQYWVPGYYVTDEHIITPDRATQPSGMYRAFFGLFQGDTRLKVVTGPQDGDNRVKLGNVVVK